MARGDILILRMPPTGPRVARPEDRLRGCLEERTALIQPTADPSHLSERYADAPVDRQWRAQHFGAMIGQRHR